MGGKLGEKVGKKLGEKVGEKTGAKVGESLGEIHKLNLCQLLNPTHRDWATHVLEDLEELGLDLELEQIEEMKRDFFKTIVKNDVQRKAFKSLINRKNSRTSENAKEK